ncbi:MAG: iron ABC transporter permease [Clostridiales bacterium]|uniref:FecCD family ABC transporter permease n=1 Tax=Zhenhengia sp. TaxID=2944208 RepID=UPI00290C60A1|nr:iron ABC transporter permease [Clostridiales bacterium]MDU6359673.1 iron ABC transporter permease [Clostridiales bacterium]MDU6855651.1 iron ABC transporter permease [Clostridiales bacterium]MDU6975576.1 iron ABC transporter permease [Clostridiales bacterium]
MKNKKLFWIISANILLITLIILFSTVGSVNLGFGEIIHELLTGDNQMVRTIVLKMRLPRNLLAVLVGANLAVAGLFLQAVMKNPLADPGITGVSSGASVGAIIILLVSPAHTGILPIVAFVGGSIACILVYAMAWKKGLQPNRIVLAGVAVNTILGGIISFFSTMYSDRIQSAMLWLNGSLATKTWGDVETLVGYSIVGLIASFFLIRSANILQLGDEAAVNLGLNIHRARIIISAVAVFLAATATAVVGIVSFVGLIVPHIARMLMGNDHKYTLPFSMALGSTVLLIADTLGRTIGGSIEIPVGIIMAIVGGPFFLYLLRKKGAY